MYNDIKEFIAHLEKLAKDCPIQDDPNFDLPKHCGKSLDCAFNLGCEQGETLLARDVLKVFKPFIESLKELQ